MAAPALERRDGDDAPDPRLLWRWAGQAARPKVGWAFLGLGGFLVLLGWFGVSRESIVEKQIPFLVSGGIGGVLLCVVGAYFLATEELRKDSGRLDRLEQMVEELHVALLDRPDAPARSTPDTDPAQPLPLTTGVVVNGGERFHRPSCAMVDGKDVEPVAVDVAGATGLRPCPLCEPVPMTGE